MRSADVQALTEQLRRARRTGAADRAAAALEVLCELDPGTPGRWKELARAYQELGRTLEAVAALVRAADLYARSGAAIAAVAVCRSILELDPTHTATIERLARLQTGDVGDPRLAHHAGTRAGADGHPRTPPIEEILLHDVVAPALAPDLDGRRELPLERAAPDPGHERRTARGLVAAPLFGQLGARALRRLIQATRCIELPEGQVVFRQGDPADALYVVVEGAVVPIAEEDGRRRLSVLGPGDFFGEIALVTNAPRNATIEALVDTELLAIDRAAITELLSVEPEALAVVLRFLRERLVARFLGTSPVFQGIDRSEAAQLVRAFRLTEVAAGTRLIEQGVPAPALFLVLAGELRVVEEGPHADKEIATLRAGAPCGEMSLREAAPASARVEAARKSWLLELPRPTLDRLASSHPRLARRLARIARARRKPR